MVINNELFDVSYLVRPMPGERVSGDTTFIHEYDDGLLLAVVDVLGHGIEANAVANDIDLYLAEHKQSDVIQGMQELHEHLKGTRGAAATLCYIDKQSGEAQLTGVGNTVFRTFGSRELRIDAQEGVLGQNMRTPRLDTYHLQSRDILLLHSDGVQSRFTQMQYPQILCHDANTITKTVIQRFGKTHDDASCICVIYHD